MFERFTERARQVVVLAQEEARGFKHDYIGTEHILLGLLREEEGLAARTLASLDVGVERVRAQVIRIAGTGEQALEGQIPFTPRGRRVLELSRREALSLGHNYIGTEHILLGLVRENEGVANRILGFFDADPEKVRNEVTQGLSGRTQAKQTATQTLGTATLEIDADTEKFEAKLTSLEERSEQVLGRMDDILEALDESALEEIELVRKGELRQFIREEVDAALARLVRASRLLG